MSLLRPAFHSHLASEDALDALGREANDPLTLSEQDRPAPAATGRFSSRPSLRQRLTFLAEASDLLGSTLDYETTVQSIARLAVPRLATWCVVDVLDESGRLQRHAAAHVEPGREATLLQLGQRFLHQPETRIHLLEALRTGEPQVYPEVTEEHYLAVALSEEHLAQLRALNTASMLVLPLQTGTNRLGAITLAWSRSDRRHYSEADVPFAEDLAHRAALAVENARLHLAVAMERDLLRQILNVLPAGVLVADERGRITLANAAAREIVGQEPRGDDTYDQHEYRFGLTHLDGEPISVEELPLARSLQRGEVVQHQQLMVRNPQSGRLIPTLANSAPIRDASGAVAGGVVVFEDISEMKEQDRQRDEFLAGLSHDLRNPLTVIRGYAEHLQRMTRRNAAPDKQKLLEGLGKIDSTASRIVALLNEMLDVARLQMGHKVELVPSATDLVALARRVADDQVATADRHVRVQVIAPSESMVGLWDSARIERVLANLLSNAIRYSTNGGRIRVRVQRVADDEGREWAEVSVEDQGIGIPAAEIPRVFERYYRGSNVPNSIGGQGIGLAGSRQIVEQHGGTIEVRSVESEGSTFTVRLPVRAEY